MTTAKRSRSGRKNEPGLEWGALRALAPYLWSQGASSAKLRIFVALLLLTGAKLATIYVPVVYGQIVDHLSADTDEVVLLPMALILAFGMLRVLSIALAELRDAVFAKVGQRAIRDVALRTFRHLHSLSLGFHLERQTGGLSHAIQRGTKAIDFVLHFMLFNILPTLIEILMVCALLWGLFDFWYSLITAMSVAIYITYTALVTEWRLKWRRRMNETDQLANTRAIDSLLNYETVKYFGNHEYEAQRYDHSLKTYEHAALISKISLSLLNIGQALIVGASMTLLVYMAAQDVIDNEMTIGDFVMVNTFLIQLFLPLNFLGYVYREIKQSLTDMEAMFHLLDEDADIKDMPGAPPLSPGPGRIEFRDVTFAYDSRRPVFKGVSFTVEAGQKVALVGPSGAGKSTAGRLLFRFYDVDGGSILVDGQDINMIAQNSLRQAIGVVPQDTVLFNDTIYYNIAYGQPNAFREHIEEAARLAAIHEFIVSTPDKYETLVGERGLKLSGGERQRVSIARTILKKPRILLFDEATSALDIHTEREIQAALDEVSRDKTTLVIAHRLSTVIDADLILVLEDGRIAERGRHEELLKLNGIYAAMWREQQRHARLQALAQHTGEKLKDDQTSNRGR